MANSMGDSIGQVDILRADVAEVEVGPNGQLWVNVDGICRLRIGSVQQVKVDNRHPSTSRWKAHDFSKGRKCGLCGMDSADSLGSFCNGK